MKANTEITKHLQNAYTNRAYAHNLNQLYDQYNISPQQGGIIHYDKEAAKDFTGEQKQTFAEFIKEYKDSTGQDNLASEEYQMLYKRFNKIEEQGDPNKDDLRQMINQQQQMNQNMMANNQMFQANQTVPGMQQSRRGGHLRTNRIKHSGYRLNDWLSQIT
tara:strand:- start:389 stop:871 length:483 start_codon:yes stop_codon:yes gene_type:complete